jgi:hypothetical protein
LFRYTLKGCINFYFSLLYRELADGRSGAFYSNGRARAPVGAEKAMQAANDSSGQNGGTSPEETARYIAALVEELAGLAHRNGLDVLGHILEMARLEADQATQV